MKSDDVILKRPVKDNDIYTLTKLLHFVLKFLSGRETSQLTFQDINFTLITNLLKNQDIKTGNGISYLFTN